MRLTDLQDNFNKKFEHLVTVQPLSHWRQWLVQRLENSTSLVNDLKESIDHPKIQELLTHIEGLLNPYLSSLGIRVSKVSPQSIELIVPDWWRTRGLKEGVDEGVLVSAAQFAIQALLRQSNLFSHIPTALVGFELHRVRTVSGQVRVRLEWSALQQEASWAELRNQSVCQVRFPISFFSQDEMLLAEMFVDQKFTLSEKLFQANSGGSAQPQEGSGHEL